MENLLRAMLSAGRIFPRERIVSGNRFAARYLPSIRRTTAAIALGMSVMGGIAHAQAPAAAPILTPTRHFPGRAPRPATGTRPVPLVPDGTTFSSGVHGPQAGAFSSQFAGIGPAPIATGYSSGNFAGRIAAIAVDPTNNSVIYVAAAGGGVWKTTNGGSSWVPLTDQLPDLAMGALTIDPTNPNVIYAGSGEANFSGDSRYGAGVYKSTNGGSTWTVYMGPGNAFYGLKISRIVVDPVTPANVYLSTVYGFSGETGVYKSTNGGGAWTKVFTPSKFSAPFTDLAIDPSSPQTLYTAIGDIFGNTANGVYKSTNGGANWTLLTGFPNGAQGNTDVGRISLALAPSNPQVLYADYSSAGVSGTFGSLGGFLRTADGGATWTVVPKSSNGTASSGVPNFLGTQGWYDNTLVVNPTNASEVFAAGVIDYNATQAGHYIAIIGSYDGGSNWTDYTYGTNFTGPHTDHHALAFTHDGGKLLDGNDGGIWRCENPNVDQTLDSIQWTNLNTNLNITQFTGIALHPTSKTIAYGGSQDNGTEKYNGTLTWDLVRGGDGGFTRLDQTNPNTVYHEYYGISLERSDDAGGSWTNIAGTTGINPNDPVVDDGDDPAAFYVPFVLDPANQSRILYGTDHLYESVNKGAHFTAIGTPGTNGFNAADNTIQTLGAYGNTIYVDAGNVLFVTTNDGASWATAAKPGSGEVSDIYVKPSNPQDVTVTISSVNGGHVYHSVNGGTGWTDISGNLPTEPFNAVKMDTGTGTLFVGGDDGVYFSANGGASWTKSGMPNVQVADIAISPGAGLVAAGTHGRGVWTSPLASSGVPVITSAKTDSAPSGAAYSYQITATNGPTAFGVQGLPAGLSVSATTGLISGTPTTPGTYTLTLNAYNAAGKGSATLTLTVVKGVPVIVSPTTAYGTQSTAFSFQIQATGSPTSYGVQGLPAGLTVNSKTGLISGTPTGTQTSTLTLNAYNSAGKGSATLTLTIAKAGTPVITSASTATGKIGVAFSYQITATKSPTQFGVQGLPPGLTVNAATGKITGTPQGAGRVTLMLNAFNSVGKGSANLILTITAQ